MIIGNNIIAIVLEDVDLSIIDEIKFIQNALELSTKDFITQYPKLYEIYFQLKRQQQEKE